MRQNVNVERALNASLNSDKTPHCEPNTTKYDDHNGRHVPTPDHHTPGELSLEWRRSRGIGAGLKNGGNTCFLNATLQCLTYTAPLVNHLLSGSHGDDGEHTSSCTLCTMRQHIIKAMSDTRAPFLPWPFISRLQSIAQHFVQGNQEDAHEFLGFLLDAMQRDDTLCQHCCSSKVISRTFEGYLQTQVECLTCHHKSNRNEPMRDVLLDIENFSGIEESLQHFSRRDDLFGDNAYFCERCNSKRPATMATTIYDPPNVLTFTLKRFSCVTGGKISKNFPYVEKLNLRPHMSQPDGPPIYYFLYAVLVHHGKRSCKGHYFSFVKVSHGTWFKMNDAFVNKVNVTEVMHQQAYLLFYVRSPDGLDGNTGTEGQNSEDVKLPTSSIKQTKTLPRIKIKIRGKHLPTLPSVCQHHANPIPRVQKDLNGTSTTCKNKRKRKETHDGGEAKRLCRGDANVGRGDVSCQELSPLEIAPQEPQREKGSKRKRECEDEDEEELWEQKSTKKRERKNNTLKGTTHTGDGSGECSQDEERGTNGRLCRVPLHLSAQLEHQLT